MPSRQIWYKVPMENPCFAWLDKKSWMILKTLNNPFKQKKTSVCTSSSQVGKFEMKCLLRVHFWPGIFFIEGTVGGSKGASTQSYTSSTIKIRFCSGTQNGFCVLQPTLTKKVQLRVKSDSISLLSYPTFRKNAMTFRNTNCINVWKNTVE